MRHKFFMSHIPKGHKMIFTQFYVKQEFIGKPAIGKPISETTDHYNSAYTNMIRFQIYKELSQTNKRKFTYIMENKQRYR